MGDSYEATLIIRRKSGEVILRKDMTFYTRDVEDLPDNDIKGIVNLRNRKCYRLANGTIIKVRVKKGCEPIYVGTSSISPKLLVKGQFRPEHMKVVEEVDCPLILKKAKFSTKRRKW